MSSRLLQETDPTPSPVIERLEARIVELEDGLGEAVRAIKSLHSDRQRLEAENERLCGLYSEWLPTAEAVNNLPPGIRKYIHDLETRCDPSGDVARFTLQNDQMHQLDAMIGRLKAQLATARAEQDALRKFIDRHWLTIQRFGSRGEA